MIMQIPRDRSCSKVGRLLTNIFLVPPPSRAKQTIYDGYCMRLDTRCRHPRKKSVSALYPGRLGLVGIIAFLRKSLTPIVICFLHFKIDNGLFQYWKMVWKSAVLCKKPLKILYMYLNWYIFVREKRKNSSLRVYEIFTIVIKKKKLLVFHKIL